MRPTRAPSQRLAALEEHTRRKRDAQRLLGVRDKLTKARDAAVRAQNSYDTTQRIAARRLAERGEDWSAEIERAAEYLRGAKECLASAEERARALGIEPEWGQDVPHVYHRTVEQ